MDWWQRQIAAAHKLSAFDGLWIDMDEVSNFCTGEVCELAPPGQPLHLALAIDKGHVAQPTFTESCLEQQASHALHQACSMT